MNFCDSKTEYHSKLAAKLAIPSTSAKTYWSILKTFANGRKVPVITLLLINSKFICDLRLNLNQQYTAISIDSSIPSSVNLVTNKTVTTIKFDEKLNSKSIVALTPHKAQL